MALEAVPPIAPASRTPPLPDPDMKLLALPVAEKKLWPTARLIVMHTTMHAPSGAGPGYLSPGCGCH